MQYLFEAIPYQGEYAIFDFTVAFLGIFLVAPLLSKLFRKIGIEIPKYNWLFFYFADCGHYPSSYRTDDSDD